MHDQRIRYSSFIFLQDVLSFFINLLLSIPKSIRTFFQYALPPKQNHEFTLEYPSLRIESPLSQCTFDLDRNLSFETHDLKDHPCEPHGTSMDNTYIPPSFVSSTTPNRYIPLHLPLIIHDFPTKRYKYLPKFDGEIKNLTAEKNLQAFEHFLDIFEVGHVDVCMRVFSLSLQGYAKEWFKHLHPKSISTWEEFSDVFLNFWGER